MRPEENWRKNDENITVDTKYDDKKEDDEK